jgi:ribonuclease P protein component
MQRLRRRSEFRAVGRGQRVTRPGFVIQALGSADSGRAPRFGFTVTRKTGNAVIRNRIRRRLKEAVRRAAEAAAPGTDYVVIARRAALRLPFDRLIDDLRSGMAALSPRARAGGRS